MQKGKKEIIDTRGNALIPDTNIIVIDPDSTISLQEKRTNTVFLARGVLNELDGLKNKPDIGFDVREALKNIEEEVIRNDSKLIVTSQMRWKETKLGDKQKVDNQIIAVAYAVYYRNKTTKEFKYIKILSNDRAVRINARLAFAGIKEVKVESYRKDVKEIIQHDAPQEIEVIYDEIGTDGVIRDVAFPDAIKENQGFIATFYDGEALKKVPAIRKGNNIITFPHNLSACGVSSWSLNGNGFNWPQCFALKQLLDPDIDLVFLLGGAGTGKTFLALAAAIAQAKDYRKILVTRPMVHLEDEDNMGFLPGDIKEKMAPWLLPINQNLRELKQIKGNDFIDKLFLDGKIEVISLDYIRGTTFTKSILIVDEAQNLTPHQVKTIITRAGEGSKVVFTGDLDQIDRKRRITSETSGLNTASNAFIGDVLAAITTFKKTLRSRLVKRALEVLE